MENKIIDRIIEQDEKKFLKDEIKAALNAYSARTSFNLQYDAPFINRLVDEFIKNKKWLVDLLKKAPSKEEAKEKGLNFWWDPELYGVWVEAIHVEPDWAKVYQRITDLIPLEKLNEEILIACHFFTAQTFDKTEFIAALNRVAPGAYAPGKKPSRILKALYSALGIVNDAAGSQFQKEFAAIADMIRPEGLTENILISVNPAHMLTMSNPKLRRDKAPFMVSCHSLDSSYDYKNGCVGYARDGSSFLLLKAASEHDKEAYYVSKTMRQLYAYDGYYLLQSRLYNTNSGRDGGYGGTEGEQAVNVVYRQIVQKVLTYCEDVANLWKTIRIAEDGQYDDYIAVNGDFEGYHDWEHAYFDCRLCIIQSKDIPENHYLRIGGAPMCFQCGDDYIGTDSTDLLCENCSEEYSTCVDCGERFRANELNEVYRNGWILYVCSDCLGNHYTWCEQCEEYYYYGEVTEVQGVYLCDDCRDRNCTQCEVCDEYYFDDSDDMYQVWHSPRFYTRMCQSCLDNALEAKEVKWCPHCERYVYTNNEEVCVSCGIVWEEDELDNQNNNEA